jgi:hypothetical protein
LTSISLYGSVAASYLGFNFALGAWFFLASIGVAYAHQLTMIGLNLYRAYGALNDSVKRMHYVQASLNNLFHLALISAVAGAIIFVMLTPIAPAIGSACALTAVALTGVNILWNILPQQWRRALKSYIGLGRPVSESDDKLERITGFTQSKTTNLEPSQHYQRLFTRGEHCSSIKSKHLDEGLIYLQREMQKK